MSAQNATITIRPATPCEYSEIQTIFFATGWLGHSLQPLFSSRSFLATAFLERYFRHPSCSAHVAVTENGAVVGYVLGCPDREHARVSLSSVLKLLRLAWHEGVLWRLKNWAYIGRWVRAGIVGELSIPHSELLHQNYPAHLHINVDASWRSSGIGARLLEHQLSVFRQQAVVGVHLATFGSRGSDHGPATRFFSQHGFRIWSQRATSLFPPLDQGSLLRIIMVKSLR